MSKETTIDSVIGKKADRLVTFENDIIRFLRKGPATVADLAKELDCSLRQVTKIVNRLSKTHSVAIRGDTVALDKPPFGYLPVSFVNSGDWIRVGLVADTHLACREERLEALHCQYDLFAREGIGLVLHAGNIVDGFVQRINGASAIVTTIDDQAAYVVDNYPARKGIETHFITGDDHEGWWIKEGFNFGNYLQSMARQHGRNDLQYLGHVEADIEFKSKFGSVIMKVQHPGGGSAYARSYTAQKQVEAFQGGEKPAILVQGHYHVNNYMHDRNVHVCSLPGFQDQTVFARKKRLRMDVGGAIVEFKQNPSDGAVTRFRVEYNMYFDRGYYRAFLRSDAKLVKGHLVVNKQSK